MKCPVFYIPILLSIVLFSCSRQKSEISSLRIVDGYIVEDSTREILYLQDMESAALIELNFVNDKIKDLNFEDFGHVEVIGQYNQNCNCLIVEQILPTRELFVLDSDN